MHRYLHCPRLGSAFYIDGPMVKRLRHHPFTVVTWVQVPLGSPFRHTKKERRQTLLFCVFFRFFGLFWAFFAEKNPFHSVLHTGGTGVEPRPFFSSFQVPQKYFFAAHKTKRIFHFLSIHYGISNRRSPNSMMFFSIYLSTPLNLNAFLNLLL